MPRALAVLLLLMAAAGAARAEDKPTASPADPPITIDRVCDLLAEHADRNGLPRAFFARLIWKESRFDPEAVSPAGAEGIAQFMPATAKRRGLKDSFDVTQAIAASAAYLKALRERFGNLGLAAAAYNSGEERVARWLSNGGFLPLETENYVLDILGEPVDSFADANHAAAVQPLQQNVPFEEACRALPVIFAATVPMAHIHTKPWGVQVAGNFRRSAAVRQYERLKKRYPELARYEPVVSRQRSAIGRRGIYAVRIGADSRAEADELCQRLRTAGGSCVVLRNR